MKNEQFFNLGTSIKITTVSKIKSFFILLYLYVSLFLFLFVNIQESTIFGDYLVPYFNGKVVIIHFVFSLAVTVLVFLQKKAIKINKVAMLLYLKFVLDILSVLINYGDVSKYLAWLVISLSCANSYLLLSNLVVTKKVYTRIRNVIILFVVIICLQVIYTALQIHTSYWDVEYKYYLNIPIGASNVISAFLIPAIPLVLLSLHNKGVKAFLIALIMTAVFLTRSRGGILLSIIALFYFVFFHGKTSNSDFKKVFGTLTGIIFFLIFFAGEKIQKLFLGYASSGGDINSITSGRLELWITIFKEFDSKYWIFGTGMKPSIGAELAGAHNILIDALVRCGIVGGLVYVCAIIKAFISSKSKESSQNVFILMVSLILINSMYEVCYFYYVCDCLLWIYLGIAYAYHNSIKRC